MDTGLVKTRRWDVAFHHRTRSRHEFSFLDQSRIGTLTRLALSGRANVLLGYYFQPQQIRTATWVRGQRFFGGVEGILYRGNRFTLNTRAVAERHIGTGRPDYNRYRTMGRITFGKRKIRPFIQNEILAVNNGFHSTRNAGGAVVQISPETTLEVSYLYDTRRTFWGGDRQALVTSIRWNPRWRLGLKSK